MTPSLGQLARSFFADHLAVQKGLRAGSIRSYRDTMRLFLCFMTEQTHRPIAQLSLHDLTLDRVLCFLKHLERRHGASWDTTNARAAARGSALNDETDIVLTIFDHIWTRLHHPRR